MPGLYSQPLRRKSWSLSLIPTFPSPPSPATSTFKMPQIKQCFPRLKTTAGAPISITVSHLKLLTPCCSHAYPLSVHVLEDNQSCNFRCKYKVPKISSCLSRWWSQTGPTDAVITEMERGISGGPGPWNPLNSRKYVLQALPSRKLLWVSSIHRLYYKCFNKSNEIITSVRTCFLIPISTLSRLRVVLSALTMSRNSKEKHDFFPAVSHIM